MSLTADQMARMSQLLDEALPLDENGRRRWLERLAPEDQALAPALQRALLPGDVTEARGFLGAPPRLVTTDPTAVPSGLATGQRVGPYELLRPLGAGGMAEVWLARRADGAFKREVALKLPLLTWSRRDLERRFAREQDILAGLEHPNIARLYDGGITEDGLPYIAMEFVPGESLTTWCDAHTLGLRERLKLFLQVLDAVGHANALGVIHRDIKPGNVLVSESGQVRLLDFGVAKLLETDGEQTQLTELYGRVLTPDYASPEYLGGEPASVASDIYSLGIMLYELLTGVRPYRLKAGGSLATLEKAIREAQTPRPSTRISGDAAKGRASTQPRLARQLRGDLDAIVLKALARDPRRRYASASALADDLHHFLSGEPVEARGQGFTYRSRNFLMRHMTGAVFGIGASLVAALISARLIAHAPAQAPPAPAAPALAHAAAPGTPDNSIAVLAFSDMSENKDQEYFSDGLADELIDRLAKIPQLNVIARTSAFSFKGKSADIPTIARTLNVANILEGSVRKSAGRLRVTTKLIRSDSGRDIWSETYDREVKDVFKVQDEIAGAVVNALQVHLLPAQGIAGERVLANRDVQGPVRPGGDRNTDSYFLYLRARDLMYRTADYAKAAAQFEQICRTDPGFAPAWAELSSVRSEVANNNNDKDEAHWDEARRIALKAISLDPQFPGGHVSLAKVYMYHDMNWSGAKAELRQALFLAPGDWAALQFSALLARFLANYDEAFEFLRRGQAADPLNGFHYGLLAATCLKAGRLDEAQAALDRVKSIFPGDHRFIYAISGNLKMERGQYAAALADFEHLPRNDAFYGIVVANYALGRREQSDAALAEYKRGQAAEDALGIAAAHAYRAEADQAATWLERAYRQHESMSDVNGDPTFRNVWADPRYKAVLRKLNFT